MSTLGNMILKGLDASKPAAAVAGRTYYATDTFLVYRDNGATWDDVTPYSITATSGAPADTPAANTARFDIGTNKLWIYNGSAWKSVTLT